eukprot:379055_1
MEQLIHFHRSIEALNDEEFAQCITTFGRDEITTMLFKQFVTEYQQTQMNNIIKMNDIINKINESNPDKNNTNIDHTNPITFITLPIDIKIKIFQQFLEEKDIYSLEQTCRDILIEARNPNSINQIAIDNLLHINKYTQNPRYSKITYCSFSMWDFDDQSVCINNTILPPLNTFHNLSEIAIGLTTFLFTNNEFNHFLNLFYAMLSNGPKDKTLYFDCDRNIKKKIKSMNLIFDANHKLDARAAILSVKHLEIFGWKCSLDNESLIHILENIISIYSIKKQKKMDDRLLDSIVLELNVPSIKKWNKHWELIQKFAKYSKKSKLTMKCDVNNENGLIKWFECMLCSDYIWFNEFTIEVTNMHFDTFLNPWNWNECKKILDIWRSKMKTNMNVSMRESGIECMNIIYIRTNLHNDRYFKKELILMEYDIENINGLEYDIEEIDNDDNEIELIISIQYSFT